MVTRLLCVCLLCVSCYGGDWMAYQGRLAKVVEYHRDNFEEVHALIVLADGRMVIAYMDNYHRDRQIQPGDCVYLCSGRYLIRRCK
jgi:hypothetical protein